MLDSINKIRKAFALQPLQKLEGGQDIQEVIANSLNKNAEGFSFHPYQNMIDISGEVGGIDSIIRILKSEGIFAWKIRNLISIQTPNDIARNL